MLATQGDYGAVRGFLHPRRDHRWSRHHAEIRMRPTFPGPYRVTVRLVATDVERGFIDFAREV